MNASTTFLLGLCILTVLAACQSSTAVDNHAEDAAAIEALSRAAIVTVGSPRLDPLKPSSISWLGSLDVVGKHPTLTSQELQQQLTGVINQQIMAKGYPLLRENGDFRLQAVVVLAAIEDESTLLRESGGMDPGLASHGNLPGKGTLVLELRQGRVTRWKGTVQIYIAPQFDNAVALRRIEYAIAQLLLTWP